MTYEMLSGGDEEWLNALTHAAGLAAAVAGGAAVVWAAAVAGDRWQVGACAAYAAVMVATFAASTLSHVFRSPARRHAMRTADQALIYLFIAASWTPMAVTWMRERPWWALHGAMWAIGIVGFVQKAALSHRVHHGSVSSGLYVVQGFLPLVAIGPLLRALPGGLLACLLAGGACFAAGLVFFRLDHRVRYFHALWHVLVVAGSASHFVGVFLYCTAARG